jgi:hypothetical protein
MKTDIHFWTYPAQILYLSIFRKSVEKIQFNYNLTRITGTLHEDQYTFLIISRSILLRMKNVSDKSCRENQNARFVFNNFFRKSCLFSSEKNIAKQGRPQMTIWRMRILCWITKVTHTICNTHCFSTATMVARTRLGVTFIRILPVLLISVLILSSHRLLRLASILRLQIMTKQKHSRPRPIATLWTRVPNTLHWKRTCSLCPKKTVSSGVSYHNKFCHVLGSIFTCGWKGGS